ncbi:hypothetical protein V6N13_001876 [Hibiscus sabdariffa]|uniref:Methionine adenosyltransferase n=1 Tax=Hibiscus sabdariffa TaxID=183260 RepID=A0ABR2G9H7_9ROSI
MRLLLSLNPVARLKSPSSILTIKATWFLFMSVLISTQHDETVTNDEITTDLKEHVIKPVIPKKYLDEKTIFQLNPSGCFIIGGPHGDAILTWQKIIIDTYKGWGAHGSGVFFRKDPTKVDRSNTYIVRHVTNSIVANGLVMRCIIQVLYAINVPKTLTEYMVEG